MKNTLSKVSKNEVFKNLKENTERGGFLHKVYGLIDPRDNKLFYIGCTKELIYFRIYSHFLESRPSDKKDLLHELLNEGNFPIVKVYYEFEDREYALLVERYLTDFMCNNNIQSKIMNKYNVSI